MPIQWIWFTQVNNEQKKDWKNTFKDILETPNDNTWWINNWINKNKLYRFKCGSTNQE